MYVPVISYYFRETFAKKIIYFNEFRSYLSPQVILAYKRLSQSTLKTRTFWSTHAVSFARFFLLWDFGFKTSLITVSVVCCSKAVPNKDSVVAGYTSLSWSIISVVFFGGFLEGPFFIFMLRSRDPGSTACQAGWCFRLCTQTLSGAEYHWIHTWPLFLYIGCIDINK